MSVGVLGGEEVAAVLLGQGVGRRVGLCPLALLNTGLILVTKDYVCNRYR